MDGEAEADLLAEQLRHTVDLLRADIAGLRRELEHERELCGRRLAALEKEAEDHELRLRSATEGVTQFKMWLGLSGGSIVMAVMALAKSFFGG